MKKTLTLRIDEQLLIKAKEKARSKGKSLSALIEDFLKEYCKD